MEQIEGQVEESVVPAETVVSTETQTQTQEQGSTETAQNNVDLSTLDVEKLAPELKAYAKSLQADYTRKTQTLAQQRKDYEQSGQYKQIVEQLVNNPEFGKWWQSQNGQQQKEMTDEEYQQALIDRKKFGELVNERVEDVVNRRLKPEIEALKQQNLVSQLNGQLDQLEKKYPDFKKVNEIGGLDAYVQRGLGYEESYALYKLHNGQKETDQKAAELASALIQKKKLSTVEKPGGLVRTGNKVVKARDFSEAFDKAFESVNKGEEVPVFERA